MNWWGKLLGGGCGLLLGGPLGALLGAAVGHKLDGRLKGLGLLRLPGGGFVFGDVERIQGAFFAATFSVMGHLTKSDGRVSEAEIALARAVMERMELTPEQRKTAIHLFNEGKRADFALAAVLGELRKVCGAQRSVLQLFLEIQVHAALADGEPNGEQRRLLLQLAGALGFAPRELERMLALARVEHRSAAGEGARQGVGRRSLQEAYALLGVEASASEAVVKQAYRRLMNQHHPDKLHAKGLPEEMVKLATDKTHEIRAAYEQIRAVRGF
jgi:DnaJ like chaperone protein